MNYTINLKLYRGVGLIELMVAMTIGMFLVLGVLAIFEQNSSTRYEIERSTRQLGNAHYASKLLTEDIRLAGNLSSFYKVTAPTITSLPNPCSTALADFQANFKIFIQGYDTPPTALTCLTDYRSGTDVIVVRRTSACAAANYLVGTNVEPGCTAVTAGEPYFQASGCVTDADAFKLNTDATQLTLKKVGCANLASVHRLYTNIYYVANNNQPGDGIPTLKRVEVGSTAAAVALVEGIENVQYEYGVDTDVFGAAGYGSPNSYSPADSVAIANWPNVVAVKIHLLSRNETVSPGYTDNKFYMLGSTRVPASGTFGDHYRRHAFSTTAVIENPLGRRQ